VFGKDRKGRREGGAEQGLLRCVQCTKGRLLAPSCLGQSKDWALQRGASGDWACQVMRQRATVSFPCARVRRDPLGERGALGVKEREREGS